MQFWFYKWKKIRNTTYTIPTRQLSKTVISSVRKKPSLVEWAKFKPSNDLYIIDCSMKNLSNIEEIRSARLQSFPERFFTISNAANARSSRCNISCTECRPKTLFSKLQQDMLPSTWIFRTLKKAMKYCKFTYWKSDPIQRLVYSLISKSSGATIQLIMHLYFYQPVL